MVFLIGRRCLDRWRSTVVSAWVRSSLWPLDRPRGLGFRLCRRFGRNGSNDLVLTRFAAHEIGARHGGRFGRSHRIERFAAIGAVELFTVQVVKRSCALFVLACPLEATRLVQNHVSSFVGSIGSFCSTLQDRTHASPLRRYGVLHFQSFPDESMKPCCGTRILAHRSSALRKPRLHFQSVPRSFR
jgi:hypothetical protein